MLQSSTSQWNPILSKKDLSRLANWKHLIHTILLQSKMYIFRMFKKHLSIYIVLISYMSDMRVLKMTISIRMITCGTMSTTWQTLSSVIQNCHKEPKRPINWSWTWYRSLQSVNYDIKAQSAGNSKWNYLPIANGQLCVHILSILQVVSMIL